MDLCYQEGFNTLEGDAQYNANISAIKWQVDGNNEGIRGYGFEYDKLDRLKGALFGLQSGSSWSRTSEDFTVTGISYDDNGNIKTLQRYGVDSLGGSTYGYGLMDDLHYVYGDDGNVLTVVEDSIGDFTFTNNDFSDGSSTAVNEYQYDKNGNLTSDANKGITSITYNWLDLPTLVSFSSGGSISYMYDADGTLLEKSINSTGYSEEIKYCGNFVYTDDTLAYIMTTEGIAKYIDDTTYRYEYFLKDHLGSVRAVFTDSDNDGTAELIGEDHYYPFGLTMGGLSYIDAGSEENKYKYNGKELQDDFGLEWYNYGFRMQDPQVGRWFCVDKMAESIISESPYTYVSNNPIKYIDLFGLYRTHMDSTYGGGNYWYRGNAPGSWNAGSIVRLVVLSELK